MANSDELKKLDKRINSLQSSLFDLYRKRQSLFSDKVDYPKALRSATIETSSTAEKYYEELRELWSEREVSIPSSSKLLPKIKAALVIIEQLSRELGVSSEVFSLVLIPPAAQFGKTQLNKYRLQQNHTRYIDQFIDQEAPVYRSRQWRLLAVYDGIDGIDMGSAEEILLSGSYQIAGLDTTALGVHEYSIYALNHRGKRDHQTWTWLLKDRAVEPWSVTFSSGAYRFAGDDAKGLGIDERFRPSVEIL